jgi:hypothetical protein
MALALKKQDKQWKLFLQLKIAGQTMETTVLKKQDTSLLSSSCDLT